MIVSRAPEHRETTVFLKVEEHNFHLVLIRSKKIKIGRKYLRLCPHRVQKISGPKKSKIFDLKNFHFHTIFNENFRSQKFSKNPKKHNFRKIFEFEKIEIFSLKIVWKWKISRSIFFFNAVRTQTDRAPRDFYEIASDQNVVRIIVFSFR